MREATEPRRTCVGCRRVGSPGEMLRVARGPGGVLGVGTTAPGRGAWVCAASSGCLERALARGSLARALRRGPFTNDEERMLRAKLWGT